MSALSDLGRACGITSRALALGVGFVLALPLSVSAQIVRGQVVDSIVGTPIAGGVVTLIDETGSEVARTMTDEEGLFLLRAQSPGQYHLRAEGEGYRVSDFPRFELAAQGMLAYRLLVPAVDPPPSTPELDDTEAELVIEQICQGTAIPGLPVMVGVVRDAVTQEPIPESDVILTWSSVTGALARLVRNPEDLQGAAVTGSSGFYAVCGVPVESRVDLRAEYQGLTSEFIALRFEGEGVYVGDSFVAMNSRLWRQDFDILPRGQRTASITGTITDTAGMRVPSANVRIVGTTYTARANLFGEFQLTGLPPGSMRLAAEVVGYQPTRIEVELGPGEDHRLPPTVLRMMPIATELAPVTIVAETPTGRRNLAEFERRRATSSGSFITRAEFMEQGTPRETTDVLRRMAGVRVRPGTGLLLPWLITSSRSFRSGNLNTICYPLVYLDRQLIGTTGNVLVNSSVPIEQVEAVEFYTGTAGMPPEFNRRGASCGVLVFWTR